MFEELHFFMAENFLMCYKMISLYLMPKISNPFLERTFVLRVELIHFEPLIWRSFTVPASITLPKLHLVLQQVMGWTNSHLHSFHSGTFCYQEQNPADRFEIQTHVRDERNVKLCDLMTRIKQAIVYEYDFGDCWEHQITLERIVSSDSTFPQVTCIDGKNACPPEDCGGIGGYADLIDILEDPTHEDHHRMRMWASSSFDPNHFDREVVNRKLYKIKIKVPAKKVKNLPEPSFS